jgi:hypothetical protein
METMRESWTDARLDDMKQGMEAGFKRVDEDIRGLRSEMNQRFDALNRTLLQISGGVIATLIAGFMGLIATQL